MQDYAIIQEWHEGLMPKNMYTFSTGITIAYFA